MVRNRIAIGLVILGIALAIVERNFPRIAAAIYPPAPTIPALRTPRDSGDVPVLWREFRDGERTTGLAAQVHICGAALERGVGRSALIVRFCGALPQTPERRYAFGFDDLVVRAQLPGGTALAYDLIWIDTARAGASRYTEGALPENGVPIKDVRIEDVTDLVFVLDREVPFGLPSIEVFGKFSGADVHDTVSFAPMGADIVAAEMARVQSTPDWARVAY